MGTLLLGKRFRRRARTGFPRLAFLSTIYPNPRLLFFLAVPCVACVWLVSGRRWFAHFVPSSVDFTLFMSLNLPRRWCVNGSTTHIYSLCVLHLGISAGSCILHASGSVSCASCYISFVRCLCPKPVMLFLLSVRQKVRQGRGRVGWVGGVGQTVDREGQEKLLGLGLGQALQARDRTETDRQGRRAPHYTSAPLPDFTR